MKIHQSAFGLMLLISLSMAKIIPTSEPTPNAAEKKNLVQEALSKPEAPEVPAEIAVEGAEEPKQVDRTKKSATTTFCVEIRPGASNGHAKVCDEQPLPAPPVSPPKEPQVPIAPHNPPPVPHHEEQKQPTLYIVPSEPVHIPNEGQHLVNDLPHILHHHHQQIQMPGCQPIIIPSHTSFPYPSFPSSPNQIIISPQGPYLYPSLPSSSQNTVIPSSGSITYPSLPSSSQQIVIPSSGSVTYPSFPSSHGQHFLFPSSQIGTSPQVIIPSTGSGLCPCQTTSTSGLYPKALLALYRSAMSQANSRMSPMPMDPAMQMRSSSPVDQLNNVNSGTSMSMEPAMEGSNQMAYGSESSDTPFARTHHTKIYTYPVATAGLGGYEAKSPYVVQCNPQVLALGRGESNVGLNSGTFRDGEGKSNMNIDNGVMNVDQSQAMNEAQMNLGETEGRHVGHYSHRRPTIHTTSGTKLYSIPTVYHHSSSHHVYPHRQIYPSHKIRPGSHFYRRDGTALNPSSDLAMQQREKDEYQQKSLNHQSVEVEQTSSGTSSIQHEKEVPASLSPSQMLNQMRLGASSVSGFSPFGKAGPVLQSFPREEEEKSSDSNKEGVDVNMHIPAGGKPFMITAPRMDDNNKDKNNVGQLFHGELAKRQIEESNTEKLTPEAEESS